MHECKHCHKRIGLRVGTVMHGSKMPFRAWMYAMTMQLLSSRQPSAKSISRYFGDRYGRKRYQPAWEMLHKLRDAMGKHDARYKLRQEIEVDEAFFTSYVPCKDKAGRKLKRGAGSHRKVKVLVMDESLTPDPEKQSINSLKKKHPFNRALGYVRMRIVSDLKQGTIYRQLCKYVAMGSTIYTDASKSHAYFSKHFNPVSQVVKPEDAGTVLPWLHICISNYKRELDDVHHGMKWDYMQYYLDSCSYRFKGGDGAMQ